MPASKDELEALEEEGIKIIFLAIEMDSSTKPRLHLSSHGCVQTRPKTPGKGTFSLIKS